VTNGNNAYTAIAQDSYNRKDTNSVVFNLPSTVNYIYDLNGNLTSDSKRGFDYDDENQLIRVTVTNSWKSEFTYDGRMRRRIRKEYAWQNSAWVQTSEVRYIYDGNLEIQWRDANNLPTLTLTRGRDLSGDFQGAGGIGGLLARTDAANGQTACFHADGNGNITALINSQQIVAAKYLYDSFGNTLSKAGTLAEANTYRFSSKDYHANSGLCYYGYRLYDSNLQRWLNGDALGELGFTVARQLDYYGDRQGDGPNLYTFVKNDSINRVDPSGLATKEKIEEIKKAIELAQRIRDVVAAALSGKGCACLDTTTGVICGCVANALINNDALEMAQCFCLANPDPKCVQNALKTTEAVVKAKEAAEKVKEAAEKVKKALEKEKKKLETPGI